PLIVSLANTGETLRLVNRPGNRPSGEGAAKRIDEAITLCRAAGFRKILLRGDTDFTQTTHLDRWHEAGDRAFIFGLDVKANRLEWVESLPPSAWTRLERPARYQIETEPRQRRDRVKQQIVDQRLYKDKRLEWEEVADSKYQPMACKREYRWIIVRKRI